MAQSPLANDPGERYAELERAYTEARWPDVLEQGGQLLADLDTDPDPVSADLANRANLLLGHAHLYGLRDPAAALPHYQAVLAGPADPDLRRIVEEALPYCQSAGSEERSSPAASPVEAIAQESATAAAATAMFNATATEDAAPSAQERSAWTVIEPTSDPLGEEINVRGDRDRWIPRAGTASEAITESATPWLDQPIQMEHPISLEKAGPSEVGGVLAVPAAVSDPMPPTLEVEVVEEPELVEVAQADPSLAEELEIELTRIKERRAANRVDAEAGQQLVASTPAPEPTPEPAAGLQEQADLDQLMLDPELLAGLLRVVVRP